MMKKENENFDSWAAPRTLPHVPPGFRPKAWTSAPATRVSRNQNPTYNENDERGESDSCSEEEPLRFTRTKRSRPQLHAPPPATGLRRRGRPPKALSMSRLETGNNNQVSSIPSRRQQEKMSSFISSHKITKDRSSLQVTEHGSGSQVSISPSPHNLVGLRWKRKTDLSGDKSGPRDVQKSSSYAEDIEETLIDISLTELPGNTRNFGCNNQISKGIDYKILQHVANALQYMAESQTALDDAEVISRSSDINENLAHTLKAINIKHGDITQDCSLESDCMKTLVLLGICKVVQELQKKQLKDLDISSLDSYYTAVRDAENMKVNVQWLRSRLDEIKDALNLSGEAKGLINERDRRVGNIDRKKKELSLRKDDLERLKRTSLSTKKLLSFRTHYFPSSSVSLASPAGFQKLGRILPCSVSPTVSTNATHYEFNDDSSEVELRLELGVECISPGEVYVDASENSLVIRVQQSGYTKTLLDTNSLYGMIKPAETIWYIDDTQLVVNLQKNDPELKWHDIVESWESLSTGVSQLLKGTSIFLVGESSEINHKIARELAVGLGYTPLSTKELLEAYTNETMDSWKNEEGSDAITEAEAAMLESLSSQARVVVATLGGKHGAARNPNKWQHLFAGFTVWLSQSDAKDEESAKEEARKNMENRQEGYTNAEVVVKLGGDWDATYTKTTAQASLSALKRLLLSEKDLKDRKSLYVRLGCRGDWPDIKAPGWDPSTAS